MKPLMANVYRAIEIDALAEPFAGASETEWRAKVASVLKGAGFETLIGKTADGLAIEPLYPRRISAAPIPGIRSAQPWSIIARVDHQEPDAANAQALDDLENGAGGLTLVFSGCRSARGFGLKANDAGALDMILAGVQLNFIELRLDAGDDLLAAIKTVETLVVRRNLSADTLLIDWGMDPAGHAAMTGDWLAGKTLLQDAVAKAAALQEAGFSGPYLRADARPYHEAGASEAQELACLIATGIAYLKALETAGWSLDTARGALSFLAVADADAFLSIAKLRALRRLWARIEAACGLEPRPIRLHAETAWRMLARRDVNTNLLRNTIAVFAAGVGGADGVCTLPATSAHGLPDALARRIARNTQSVLIEEANLWRVSDPVAGAGGFEALTDGLCAEAWALLQTLEARGGMLASLEQGHIQPLIAMVCSERMAALAKGEATIVGTTRFLNEDEERVDGIANAAIKRSMASVALPSVRLSQGFEDRCA